MEVMMGKATKARVMLEMEMKAVKAKRMGEVAAVEGRKVEGAAAVGEIVVEERRVGKMGMKLILKYPLMVMGMMEVAPMECMEELVVVTVIMLEAMNMVITTSTQATGIT